MDKHSHKIELIFYCSRDFINKTLPKLNFYNITKELNIVVELGENNMSPFILVKGDSNRKDEIANKFSNFLHYQRNNY